MNCSECEGALTGRPYTAILVEVMGDEYGYIYGYCAACDVYTELSSRDSFTMGYAEHPPGTISKEKGDEIVRLIETYPNVFDSCCTCPQDGEQEALEVAQQKFEQNKDWWEANRDVWNIES